MKSFKDIVSALGGEDKLLHACACVLLTIFASSLVCHFGGNTPAVGGVIGALTALFVGIVKELYDFFTGGEFDRHDLLADFIGCVVGFVYVVTVF